MLEKVITYITAGERLLVFAHVDIPAAGIQVPAGTIEEGEAPETAALREAFEETGLDQLHVVTHLGSDTWRPANAPQTATVRRHFFHLEFEGEPEAKWRHWEVHADGGAHPPIEFECFWVSYPEEVPVLAGDQGAMLDRLKPQPSTNTSPQS